MDPRVARQVRQVRLVHKDRQDRPDREAAEEIRATKDLWATTGQKLSKDHRGRPDPRGYMDRRVFPVLRGNVGRGVQSGQEND